MKKNIIFWLDGDISYFGLAKHLQSLLDYDISAIFDITDKPKKFFIQQKIVDFKKFGFIMTILEKLIKKLI